MNLGETIYQHRVNRNLSQGDLANMLDVSRQSVSKWENNSAVPDLDKIVKICEIFEISIDELVYGKEDNNKDEKRGSIEPKANVTVQEVIHNKGSASTAGTILLCMSFLTVFICSFLGGFLVGLICCIPFLTCGIICMAAKQNAGLWCAWAIYFMVDTYLRLFTGTQRGSIFNFFYLMHGQRYLTITVILGWVLMISMAILTWITVCRFKNKPFAWNKKNKIRIISIVAVVVIIQLLQIILPKTAYYSYYLAHIVDMGTVHNIVYGIVDWIKVILIIILIVNSAKINLKRTVWATIAIWSIYFIVNLITNLSVAEKMNENIQLQEKTLYEHGLDVVGMLNEIVNSEEYIQAFTGSPDLINKIKDISKGVYFIPEKVYKITLDAESVLEISEMQ